MIPFAASVEFYSGRLAALLDGEDSFPEITGKDRARTRIAGGVLLTLPVAGGGSVMKRRDVEDVTLSDHGRWRDVHLGALKAAYGKTPFFIHLYPEIEKVYSEKGEGGLPDFTEAIHNVIKQWLGLDGRMISQLRVLKKEHPDRIRVLKERMLPAGQNTGLSILDMLFRYGKETVIALL